MKELNGLAILPYDELENMKLLKLVKIKNNVYAVTKNNIINQFELRNTIAENRLYNIESWQPFENIEEVC
jgi:hypothetical protein